MVPSKVRTSADRCADSGVEGFVPTSASPPPTVFADMINVIFDSTIPYDMRFFQSLDRMVQYEPWLPRDSMDELLDAHGTMIAAIEAAPMPGKRLVPFALRPLTDREKAVADSTLLDPEWPDELFEPIGRRRGLGAEHRSKYWLAVLALGTSSEEE